MCSSLPDLPFFVFLSVSVRLSLNLPPFPPPSQVVRREDPDILIGYEVQMSSWGYLIQRGEALGFDAAAELSRIFDNPAAARRGDQDATDATAKEAQAARPEVQYSARHTSEFSVGGRVLLNLWRLMRHELALNGYSFEKVAYHVLHLRLPFYAQHTLRDWYNGPGVQRRWRTLRHVARRVLGNLQLTYELNLVGRTSEFARLFGILFYEVLHRGSQFRVESIMLRIAHRQNYALISPSKDQVRRVGVVGGGGGGRKRKGR